MSNNTIIVTIKLFGAYRDIYNLNELQLETTIGTSLKILKKQMMDNILLKNHMDLINSSAFASQNEILNIDTVLTKNLTINILPPVCGG